MYIYIHMGLGQSGGDTLHLWDTPHLHAWPLIAAPGPISSDGLGRRRAVPLKCSFEDGPGGAATGAFSMGSSTNKQWDMEVS